MDIETDWHIRNAEENDLPFIYSSWTQSYRYGSPLGKSCHNKIFFPNFARVIDWILMRDQIKVRVACYPEDRSIIFGYLVHEPHILHYAFTKEHFRQKGIAKSLYNHAGPLEFNSFKTFDSVHALKTHSELIFNPFILFHQQGESHGSE
jgi:hypothetical protein